VQKKKFALALFNQDVGLEIASCSVYVIIHWFCLTLTALKNLMELKQYTVSLRLIGVILLFIIFLDGNETFSNSLMSSVSLLGLIWRENANMSNVKGGLKIKILLALSIRVSILFAYRILSYVTVSKIFTKGLIDEKNK
jgi:hypothetical protein